MLKDNGGRKEPPEQVAERKWRNNALRTKYKEGKMPVVAIVDPETIDYVNQKIHLPKEAPPEIGSIIPTNEAEKKLVRDRKQRALRQLFSFLYEDMERKKILIKAVRPEINLLVHERERRILLLEKIRRLEASIAQREQESGK